MALVASPVGGAYTWNQAATPGTNASARCTSSSDTFAVGDLILCIWHSQENSVDDWTISTTPVLSGGAVGAVTVYGPAEFAEGGGYQAHAKFAVCQVTTGWTGTIAFDRTPAGTADHWTAACFVKITGHDTTTPVIQVISVNGAGGGTGTASFPSFTATPPSTAFAFGGGSAGQSTAAWTPPSGFTEDLDQDSYGPATVFHKFGSVSQSVGSITVSNVSTFGFQASIILIAEAASGTPDKLLEEDGFKILLENGLDGLGIESIATAGGTNVSASVVAAIGAVPSPTEVVTPTPAVVAAIVAVPSPTKVVIEPATTVAAVTAVNAPTVTTTVTPTPAVVTAVVAIPSPTPTASGTTTTTTVTAVVAIPAPTIVTGVVATTTTVTAVAAVPSPTDTASGTATTTTVAAVASVPSPTVGTVVSTTATVVAAVVAVNAPAPTASGTTTAAVVAAVASIPTIGLNIALLIPTVTAIVAIPTPVFGLNPTVVPAVVSIPVNFNITVPVATTQVPSYSKRRRSPRVRKPSVVGGSM